MTYKVSCLILAGEDFSMIDRDQRVLATRRSFETIGEAERYAEGIAESRQAQVHRACIWCGEGWRMDGETGDWPRCEFCGGS